MGIKQVKGPLTKGVARVPIVMQMEAVECGAACLTMIFAYYGRYIPLEKVREDCGVSRDGSNLKNMYLVAQNQGFEAKAFKLEYNRLKERASFPCIVFVEGGHFVVLNGFKKNAVYINNPAKGIIKMPEQDFIAIYSGFCMTLKPTDKFEPYGRPVTIFDFVKDQLKGTGKMVALVLLTTLIMTLVNMCLPGIDRFFVDQILVKSGVTVGLLFYTMYLTLVVIQLIALWIKSAYMIKLQGKMSITACTTFVWHLMSLPCRFYEQRMTGDLLERYNSNQELATNIINNITPVVLDVASLLFYALMMVSYSPLLAGIGIFSVLVNLFITRAISNQRTNITRVMAKNTAALNVATLSGIEMIETIKSSGVENNFFQNWADIYGDYSEQNMNLSKLAVRFGQIPDMISMLTSNIVIIIGAIWVMHGNWTIGILVAFNAYLSSFSAPAKSVENVSKVFLEMKTETERVQDVMHYSREYDLSKDEIEKGKSYRKLGDRLELKNITFGYNRLLPPLLKDFSLVLEAGKSIAIVGGSGSGKSTVAKLISGLQTPWSGSIMLDGTDIENIPREIRAISIGYVTQDTTFFESSIGDNIRMYDDTVESYDVILAARDVKIHKDILSREGGYSAELKERGANFSGGQRQRMSIARILARNPRILILDEATAALDAETEYGVMKAIYNRNISTVVISHRLSIIRDCDEIIVLEKGVIVDRGRHEYLMEHCPYYASLVTSV